MGWLDDYLEYTAHHEAPEAFHTWVGISAIASSLGRSVWLDCEHYQLFPNFYIVLVGRSGLRKSSAIRQAVDLMAEVPQIVIMQERITGAMFLVDLQRAGAQRSQQMISAGIIEENEVNTSASAVLVAPELSVFLRRDAVTSGLIADLTSLYDCPAEWPYKTKTQGVHYLYNVCPNIIGATTPKDFNTIITSDVLATGFAARLIIVLGRQKRKRPLFHSPEVHKKREQMRPVLVDRLREIACMTGPMTLERDARLLLAEWYESRPLTPDRRVEGFEEREHDFIMKLGMVFAAADGCGYVIGKKHIERAMGLTHKTKQSYEEAYKYVGGHTLLEHSDKVLEQIRQKGRATFTQLMRRNWYDLTDKTLREVLDMLQTAGYIREVHDAKGRSTFYPIEEESPVAPEVSGGTAEED